MMAQSTRSILLDALARGYQMFRRRLDAAIGSKDLASEALHETWLDLHKGNEPDRVINPNGYIYIAALRKARQMRKDEQRRLDRFETRELLDLADEAPDPERIAAGRSELASLHKTLALLTSRQRQVFVDFYLGDTSKDELAERLGVSERTIRNELREALARIARRMMDEESFQDRRDDPSIQSGG